MKPFIPIAFFLLMLSAPVLGQPVYELLPSGVQNNERVGAAVDLDGDVAVVGAPGIGAAYVFRFNGADWVEEQTLTPSFIGGAFGEAVAIGGESIVIGAPGAGSSTAGTAFFYRFTNGTWVEVGSFRKTGGQAIVKYAESVDVDGDRAVVADHVVNDGQKNEDDENNGAEN